MSKVKATFSYNATEAGELSIKKGDIILVLEEDETGWWKGELNGVVGFFPSNFVEVHVEANSATGWGERRLSLAPKPKFVKKEEKKKDEEEDTDDFVVAKHNYKGSAADGELSFSRGDVLKVLAVDDSGWWKGELKGKIGFFPHNFVVKYDKNKERKKREAKDKAAEAKLASAKPPKITATNTNANNNANRAKDLEKALENERKVSADLRGNASGLEERVKFLMKENSSIKKELLELREGKGRTFKRLEELEEEKERVEIRLNRMMGMDIDDLDVNELRELKHVQKAGLEKVKLMSTKLKLCPQCELAVKDSILVPCLHAFCQKCGETNKKEGTCSSCGLVPEKIYVLSNKKK